MVGVVETAGHRFPVPRPALQFQDVLHWPLVASFPGVSVCVHECIRVVIFSLYKAVLSFLSSCYKAEKSFKRFCRK